MSITLRQATMDDAERLYVWRLDPETQAASITQMEPDFEAHCAWLLSKIESDETFILMAEINGRCVGTTRLDYTASDAWELSWTVHPHFRRQGIGKAMVQEMRSFWPTPLVALIKPDNVASVKIAESAGIEWTDA